MSKITTYSFGKLPTLSSVTWSSDEMRRSWKWNGRSMESVIQRFIQLNKRNLDYIGITTAIIDNNGKPALKLTASKYVGSVPIFSPINGMAVGDLIVTGRFGENAEELIGLLDSNIKPDYSDEFHLVQDSQMTPPIFLECCKFIDTYIDSERFHWRKFANEVKVQKQPSSSTLWTEYAIRTAKNPLEFSTFKNKCNILTEDHDEWAQLNYVLTIAISELESIRAPRRTRAIYADRIAYLKIKLQDKRKLQTDKIVKRMSDPYIIKQLKDLGSIILRNKTNEKLAWKMDYAEFFERYVQFLFNKVAKKKGAREIDNPHYGISATSRPAWGLSYLEPDLILQKEDDQYVIDAKYKSHIFNWDDGTEDLKDTFRHDFHQILAYCSFNNVRTKKAMLVYPFSEFVSRRLRINSSLNHSDAYVYLVGIPLEKAKIGETQEKLSELITFENSLE